MEGRGCAWAPSACSSRLGGRRRRRRVPAALCALWSSLAAAAWCGAATAAPAPAPPPAHVEVPATASTVAVGEMRADAVAAAAVADGGTVTLRAVSGRLPGAAHTDAGFALPKETAEVFKNACPHGDDAQTFFSSHAVFPCNLPGPHPLTGPVRVDGAEPGDVLRVDVLDVKVWGTFAWNSVRYGAGALPLAPFLIDHAKAKIETYALDPERQVCTVPWGPGGEPIELSFANRSFFGILAVAPPPEFGPMSSAAPHPKFGGNIDLRELTPGSTLWLPVNVPGALFYAGDGHAMQGDGEITATGMEASLDGTFRLTVEKRSEGLTTPRAMTPTHYISLGLGETLESAQTAAIEDMLRWLVADLAPGMSEEAAYRLLSFVGDLRITQTVNSNKGVHIMVPKDALGGAGQQRRARSDGEL